MIYHFFKTLHVHLCASSKLAGSTRDGSFSSTIPRNIIRRTLIDYLNLSQQKRISLSEIDIILLALPTQVQSFLLNHLFNYSIYLHIIYLIVEHSKCFILFCCMYISSNWC